MNLVEEKRKNNNFLVQTNKRYVTLLKKFKKFKLKNLFDKIHKLIVKELKFNVNYHIKIGKHHNLLQV
jgi:hypothetical protein